MPEDTWRDPIVEEVRRVRSEHAARFHYDLRAIAADLRKRQAESGRQVVSYPPRRTNDEQSSEGAA